VHRGNPIKVRRLPHSRAWIFAFIVGGIVGNFWIDPALFNNFWKIRGRGGGSKEGKDLRDMELEETDQSLFNFVNPVYLSPNIRAFGLHPDYVHMSLIFI